MHATADTTAVKFLLRLGAARDARRYASPISRLDTMSKRTLEYDRDAILSLLRDLDQIVVSLDRIGSSAADMSREETNATLAAFMSEWRVFGKLAHVRRVLSEPFSDELGPDEMDELEREMQDVEYWSVSRRLPAKDA